MKKVNKLLFGIFSLIFSSTIFAQATIAIDAYYCKIHKKYEAWETSCNSKKSNYSSAPTSQNNVNNQQQLENQRRLQEIQNQLNAINNQYEQRKKNTQEISNTIQSGIQQIADILQRKRDREAAEAEERRVRKEKERLEQKLRDEQRRQEQEEQDRADKAERERLKNEIEGKLNKLFKATTNGLSLTQLRANQTTEDLKKGFYFKYAVNESGTSAFLIGLQENKYNDDSWMLQADFNAAIDKKQNYLFTKNKFTPYWTWFFGCYTTATAVKQVMNTIQKNAKEQGLIVYIENEIFELNPSAEKLKEQAKTFWDEETKQEEQPQEQIQQIDTVAADNEPTADEWNDKGVEWAQIKNYKEANKCYRIAINKGSVEALYNLAINYEYGQGVTKSPALSFKYMKDAATIGDIDAQFKLSQYYYDGFGTVKSIINGKKWIIKSVEGEEKSVLGAYYLAGYYEDEHHGFKLNCDSVIYYYTIAANLGDADAQYELGYRSQYGKGNLYRKLSDENPVCTNIPINITEAISWYKKSAEQKNMSAMYELGVLYIEGAAGIDKDKEKGKQLLKDAVKEGSELAKDYLKTLKQ